jgi:hypothetical protein
MVRELFLSTQVRVREMEEEARTLSHPSERIRQLTTTHLNYLGVEHKFLEELRSELKKVEGTSKEEKIFRKVKSLLRWIARGERRDFRRESRILDQVEKVIETANGYLKFPELTKHLDLKEIPRKVSTLFNQFLLFHYKLTSELSSRGVLWKYVHNFMDTLDTINTLSSDRERTLVVKHKVTLIEMEKGIDKVIDEAETVIKGMQTVLKEIEGALKTLVSSVYNESDINFMGEVKSWEIDKARDNFPKLYEVLVKHGKLNAAFEGGTFNPWKEEQLGYLMLYKEKRWKEMDQVYEEDVTYRTRNKVPPANPYLLFNILDGSGQLQKAKVREEIFTHPSYFFRRYILLPAVIHYGWKMSWRIGQNNVKIIMKASGRKLPLFSTQTTKVRYADLEEENIYDMDSGIIAFAHPFNDTIDGGSKYGYSADEEYSGNNPIYVGFIFKKPPMEKMLQECGYKRGTFIIPHSVFLTKERTQDWLDLTPAYKIFVKQ